MHFTVFSDSQEQLAAKSEIQDNSPTSRSSGDKWDEFKSKKNLFLSYLKSKFANQETNGECSNQNKQKVFIPAVHVFMQPNVIHQRKKIQRKSSCPDITQTGVKLQISRNSSLPNFCETPGHVSPRKCPLQSSGTEPKQLSKIASESNIGVLSVPEKFPKMMRFQRLQSVDEGPKGD
eukprot:GFUD01006985.1.p1 GENE.GFUD01006985.1~~GFUD01006985.1.p1  ORF type:complete len:177 (-),score=42.45 GFUD01006985.1:130-660(-)